jgi:hypothetical protein
MNTQSGRNQHIITLSPQRKEEEELQEVVVLQEEELHLLIIVLLPEVDLTLVLKAKVPMMIDTQKL